MARTVWTDPTLTPLASKIKSDHIKELRTAVNKLEDFKDGAAGPGLTMKGDALEVGSGQGIQVDAQSITIKLDGNTLVKGSNGVKVNTGHGNGLDADKLDGNEAAAFIKHAMGQGDNDFMVGKAAEGGSWISRTVVQVRNILGLGSAAYTETTAYATAAKGVTNGDSHDHVGGDGAQIDYKSLANKPLVGSNTFAGLTGKTITHNIGNTNYIVSVTPIGVPPGTLGDIGVVKNSANIVVYNTGSYTGSFDYVITLI